MQIPLDYTAIIIAVIGLIGTLGVAYIGRNKIYKQKHMRHQAEQEMKFQRAALDFAMFLDTWSEIVDEVKRLFADTDAERFIIFRAFNGAVDPRWTTGVLQMRVNGQEPVSYVHYELDGDYKARLRMIGERNFARVITSELGDCGIKQVYEAEGVTDSLWCFIDKRILPETGSVAITYCSVATTKEGGMSEETITRIKVLAGRLKGAAIAFGDGSNNAAP